MKKLAMMALTAVAIAMPSRADAQLSGDGCYLGLFQTCVKFSLVNTAGTSWELKVKNTDPVQKFSEFLVIIGAGTPTVSAVVASNSWEYNGSQGGGIFFNGNPAVSMLNLEFTKDKDTPNADFFLDSGEEATVTFNLTGVTPIGFGVHAQQGPNGQSQRIRFGEGNLVTTSVVPEPSTYALMATGLLGIFGFARRRRNNA